VCCSEIRGPAALLDTARRSVGEHRLAQESTIAPLDCSAHSRPIQVMSLSPDDTEYEVSELSIPTGAYNKIYTIPLNRTSPAMTRNLNSAGISPKDSKAYATTFLTGVGHFLIRHDANAVEFVAKLPPPTKFHKEAEGYNSAAFSLSGAYYLVTKGLHQSMIVIKGLDAYAGYASQSDKRIPDLSQTLTGFSLGAPRRIADMAAVPMDLDDSGEVVDYVFMLDRAPALYVVKVAPAGNTLWQLKASGDGLDTARRLGFGSAWSYEQKIYFASNLGEGVFEVDQTSIDLKAKTVTMKNVGKSAKAVNNDGMNCLASQSPWPEQGDCAKGFMEVDVVNGQCPAGSTKKQAPK